jgi:hypothetical protein
MAKASARWVTLGSSHERRRGPGRGADAPLPFAYVPGAVVHPDHRTIVLRAWLRVVPNTEHVEAPLPGIDCYD